MPPQTARSTNSTAAGAASTGTATAATTAAAAAAATAAAAAATAAAAAATAAAASGPAPMRSWQVGDLAVAIAHLGGGRLTYCSSMVLGRTQASPFVAVHLHRPTVTCASSSEM